MLLAGEDMVGGYGGTRVLNGLSLGVNRGEIVVIVGPNGAGKSTAMKALLGLVKLDQGRVIFAGKPMTSFSPEARIRLGIAFTPQTENVFSSLTVRENLEMGAYLRKGGTEERMEELFALFPVLRDRQNQAAGSLSGGQRQQAAIARAMMTEPDALLLDEPTAGVSPAVTDELFERIIAIAERGLAVMIVEQNARQALEIAHRGYVLVGGSVRYEGKGHELLADQEVRKTFLGGIPYHA